mmetsp:Transcript_56812/g.130467  ORF Transcript_56812/g.130467 Transcript_56812/m.130467 type:complete len:257 (+) Transcript_56812:1119-1889(+)
MGRSSCCCSSPRAWLLWSSMQPLSLELFSRVQLRNAPRKAQSADTFATHVKGSIASAGRACMSTGSTHHGPRWSVLSGGEAPPSINTCNPCDAVSARAAGPPCALPGPPLSALCRSSSHPSSHVSASTGSVASLVAAAPPSASHWHQRRASDHFGVPPGGRHSRAAICVSAPYEDSTLRRLGSSASLAPADWQWPLHNSQLPFGLSSLTGTTTQTARPGLPCSAACRTRTYSSHSALHSRGSVGRSTKTRPWHDTT